MRRLLGVFGVLVLLSAAALAAPPSLEKTQPFPKTLINARYVYITSYDGNQFNWSILPEDRQAIADVQNAIQQWGRYIVVYNPRQADMIIAVQRRGSEDTIAVYDARLGRESTYLWRAMGREGLQPNEMPLFSQLRQAVEAASK